MPFLKNRSCFQINNGTAKLGRAIFILLLVLGIFVDISCRREVNDSASESTYFTYCGSCHLAPNPKHIPQSLWEEVVLPEMATRMGYSYQTHDNPLSIFTMEDEIFPNLPQTQPATPGMDSATWQQILNYVSGHAPDSIPIDKERSKRNTALVRFNPLPISLDSRELGGITSIQFEPLKNQFMIGDSRGRLCQWPKALGKSPRFRSPIISQQHMEEGLYATEIGYMAPSKEALGLIHRIQTASIDTLARGLHRPVYMEIADLNEDGLNEILICEFGDLEGGIVFIHG